MATVKPVGNVTRYPGARYGVAHPLYYNRVWNTERDWQCSGAEIVHPLGAIAPAADPRPVDMHLVDFTKGGNGKFRETRVRGNPTATWLEYYDATAYEVSGDWYLPEAFGGLTSISMMYPNLALHLLRGTPPENQGIPTLMLIGMDCEWLMPDETWAEGTLVLVLPFRSPAYSMPMWWVAATRTPQYGPLAATWKVIGGWEEYSNWQQGPVAESWLIEHQMIWHDYKEPAAFGGTHLLVRNTNVGGWWHTHSERLRMVESPIAVLCAGAAMAFNLKELAYDSCSAWPRYGEDLPEGLPVSGTPAWNWFYGGGDREHPDDWTLSVMNVIGAQNVQPQVFFSTGIARTTRPMLWRVDERRRATFGNTSATSATTEGDDVLDELMVQLNDNWKGATSSLRFKPVAAALYTDWQARDELAITMGWQDDVTYPPAMVAHHYIRPGGINRETTEDGRCELSIDAGDYAYVWMPRAQVYCDIDPTGETLSDWWTYVWEAIGVPASRLAIYDDLGGHRIPWKSLPSETAFRTRQGELWSDHINAVLKAMGLRWGVDKLGDGKAFIDAGRPVWESGGTPDFIIADEASGINMVLRGMSKRQDDEAKVNAIKLIIDGAAGYEEWHSVASAAERAADGGTLWEVVNGETPGDAIRQIDEILAEAAKAPHGLTSGTRLHHDLRPDMFVKVDTDGYTDIAAGSVFQIRNATHRAAGRLTSNTALYGEIVHEPA